MGMGVVLVGILVSLIVVESSGDALKGVPNDFKTTGDNITVKDSTGQRIVPASVKVYHGVTTKDLGKGMHGEMKNSENMNVVKNSSDFEDKQVKEPVTKGGQVLLGKGSASDTVLKENNRMEECDTVHSCIHEKSKLVACLRVPGNDSPTLSLLIQNKGTALFTVGISVPDFVKVEESSILLHAKEEKRVKVSIKDGVSDSSILLTAAEWHCNLNFSDMIPDSIVKGEHLTVHVKAKISRWASFIYVFLAAVIIVVAVFLWMRFRHASLLEIPNYQKLETVLPVSRGGMKETDVTDNWDSGWDNWDDEEAPTTPSNPALSLSSKGLASRRSNKEGWRD